MTCWVEQDGTGWDGTSQLAATTVWDCLQSILVPSVVKATPRSCKNLRHCSSSVKPNSDSTKETAIEGRYLQHTAQQDEKEHRGRTERNGKKAK